MVDQIGLYSGIRPFKGARAITAFDMSVGGTNFEYNGGDPNVALSHDTTLGKPPREFTQIVFPNPLRGVLPCKGEPESIKHGRPEASLTGGMYPPQGYARHQKKGLATDFNKPMNLPVMPIPGFYNPDAPNVLGNVPG
jgi:hypothetical protein